MVSHINTKTVTHFRKLGLLIVIMGLVCKYFSFLDYSIQLQTFNSLQKDLQSYVNTSTSKILPHLDHIIALLHQAIATCIAATKVTKPPEPIDKKENLPPGKCLERQWRFVKTTKLPGRKRKGNVLR